MKDYTNKQDSVLVQLTLLGNENAYEELVTRYERAVKGTAYKVTGNAYSAEDASQDAFVSAWVNLSALRDGDKFGSWVCAIAKNHAHSLMRHYAAAIPAISLHDLENTDLLGADQRQMAAADLQEAVDALSDKVRQTVRLHYFEGLSVKEIAVQLQIAEGTVKWRLSEGRKQLRKGYGVMENTYNEQETLKSRIMRQVEQLKLWRLKEDKAGFEDDYRAVLAMVELLDEGPDKQSLLADTLLVGYWWLPGEKQDDTVERIRQAALAGHNDEVMSAVALTDSTKFNGDKCIDYMLNTQIPYYTAENFPKAVGILWFWLGFEYRQKQQYAQAIEAFRQTVEILPPHEVYHANALAAIQVEQTVLAHPGVKVGIHATGEVMRYVGDKLYFWTQPGYGADRHDKVNNYIFLKCENHDGLVYDPAMKVGDKAVSSDGLSTLTFLEDGKTVDTPAGRFEGCQVWECVGEKNGYTYSKTAFRPGVGIVWQTSTRCGTPCEWVLKAYCINGGEGIIPFAPGNRWEYSLVDDVPVVDMQVENVFEVTAYEQGEATYYNACHIIYRDYLNTWEGQTTRMSHEFVRCLEDGQQELVDVTSILRRAEELAATRRQRTQTAVAMEVWQRIRDTDPVLNPDYTQKGRWNFFSYHPVWRRERRVVVLENRQCAFEWKDMRRCGDEGYKILYSFFDSILDDAMGCQWSDEWVDGYRLAQKRRRGGNITTNCEVNGGETVTTPAGTFADCRHLTFELKRRSPSYFDGKSDYWFAPGVGIVKFTHPFGEGCCAVWQLTAYQGTGEGYFPTDDGFTRRYEPEGVGDGWHGALEFTYLEDENSTVVLRNALGTQDRADYEVSQA